jgi:competence protein ComEC
VGSAVLSVTIVSGVALGLVTGTWPADALAYAMAAASLAIVVEHRRRRLGLSLLATFLAATAYGSASAAGVLESPLRGWPHHAPDVAVVSGTLTEDGTATEDAVRLSIDVETVNSVKVSGRIQVHVNGEMAALRVAEWTAGRRIVAPVLLRAPTSWRNPGRASERWQRLHQRADLVGTIKSAALVEVAPGRWWDEAAARARRHVRHAAGRHVAPHSPQSAAIVAAILIGDRTGLAADVQERLRAAGTYHVVAISGGNVAIFAALSFASLGLVLRSFRAVSIVTILVIVGYGAIVGDEPSVRRAITAACVYLLLSAAGVRVGAVNIVGVTALMLTAVDPLIVLDAGAWLSFGATLGILLGAAQFTAWATASGGAARSPGHVSFGRHCWLATLGLLAATVAAELALLPIAAALFARVGLLGLVLNFVAIPAMTIVQLSGMAMTAFAGWWEGPAALFGWAAATAAAWLIDSSRAVDLAPWLVWRVPPVSILWSVAFYGGLAGALALRRHLWTRRVAIAVTVVSAAAIVTAPGLHLAGPPSGRLRVTLLDVGQGDSIAVQFPDGHSLLIDAGGVPGSSFDLGERVVTPALWALGIRRLDWLAVTHGDIDHAGGLASVERDLRPREVWEGVSVPPNRALQLLREQVHRHRGAWRQILAGHRLELGGVVLEALHPPVPDWERRRVRNDDSLVFRIRFGIVDFLLTGDAGREFEDRFVDPEPRARLRLLKVGHHGSRTSSSPDFLNAVAPHMALISAGRGNTFGHPTPDVVARLEQLDAIVFRTDLDGAIRIETDGAFVDARSMSGRRWTISAN